MQRNTNRLLLLGLALGTVAGCSLVVDPGPLQGGPPADDDAGSDDAGHEDAGRDAGQDAGQDAGHDAGRTEPIDGGTCAAPFTCRAAVPPGWTGPIVLVSGPGDETAPICPGTAPTTAFETLSGWSGEPATCRCTCAEPAAHQLTCSAATLRTSSTCSGGSSHTTVTANQCKSISALPSTGSWLASAVSFTGTGTCAPQPSVATSPVEWAQAHRGCTSGPAIACDGGICAPPIEEGQRLCVYIDGEASCPLGFPDRVLTAEDVLDERGCSECTCGVVVGSCTGSLQIASACSGTPLLHASIPLGGCTSAGTAAGTHHVRGAFSASGSCPAGTVFPEGELIPQQVRTVCCATP